MAHCIAFIGSARQRRDIDETWIPRRGLVIAGRRELARPWVLPLPPLPTIQRRGNAFVDSASQRLCPPLSAPRAYDARQVERAAALQIRLDGSAGHRIVDLLQGGKVVSVLCAVCGSYGGRVVRQPLLSNCPGAQTPGRQLALRDVLLGFLPVSKRTVHLDRVPGKVFFWQQRC